MSTLIASATDITDAHRGVEQELVYHDKIKELVETTDKFPWKFEVLQGFFKQTDPATDDTKFNYAQDNMGRLKSWEQIIGDLKKLNSEAAENESFKLIFLGRHGQGFHNVVADKYGYEEWKRKWHRLARDGDIVYGPDPMLTELGVRQAKENNQLWHQEVKAGAPVPSKFYVSPLQRSSHTLVYTFDGIKEPHHKPVVTELIRETNGINLCNQRSTKTVISQRFGTHGFEFEPGFKEEDELWNPDVVESFWEHCVRINTFLQGLFDEDLDASNKLDRELAHKHTVVSTTSHAGSIRCFITVLGHRRFTISTGGMIPVVVKATRTQ